MDREEIAGFYRAQGAWKNETLSARFAHVFGLASGRVALVDGATSLTFREVAECVERVAGHLGARGIGPGDVVSWQLPNWWEAAVLHHAALRIGALPNPLNMIFRGRELRFVLGQARPALLVVPQRFRRFDHAALARTLADEGLADRVAVVRGESDGAESIDAWLAEPSQHEVAPPLQRPSDAALLLYTSGTTSNPKGVLHSHETLLYEMDSLRAVHQISGEDCYLGGSPVTHIAGLVYGLLMPFALGTRTALLDRWEPGHALALIERVRATFQTGAPTFLQTLAEHPDVARRDLSSFRLFSTGGANIPTEPIRTAEARLGCTVKRAYGSTEVPTLTATAFDDPDDLRLGTDGRAISAAEMRIVGDGRDVSAGDEGEIWARTPEVFIGYRDPALDADAFDPEGWFRTGDLGRVDADGYLRVTGRLKDVIIRGGENISVKEIEDLLAEHPSVADVAVVGMPDPVLGERACAFVAPRRGADALTFEDMVTYLESREIARQKIPEKLVVRSRLPKTASGKVMKTSLRAEFEQG
ncbi:MAG: AMP-binding protein [Actinomycetota bacterium]